VALLARQAGKAAGGPKGPKRIKGKTQLKRAEEQIADLTAQLETAFLHKESLRLRNQLLKKGLVQGLAPVEESESHARLLDIQTLRFVQTELDIRSDITLTASGKPVTLAVQQVRELSQEPYAALLDQYFNAFARMIPLCDEADPDSPAYRRLDQLVNEMFQLQAMYAMTRTNLGHGGHVCVGRAHDAAGELPVLALAAPQRVALLALRRVCARNVGAVIARRRCLQSMLQAMEPLPADASEARPHGAAHCPGAARSEGLVMLERPDGIAMLEGLQQLVAEEHSQVVALNLGVRRHVLTPFQTASYSLQARLSAMTDVFGLLEGLAQSAAEPNFHDLVQEAIQLPQGPEVVIMSLDVAIMSVSDFLAGRPSLYSSEPDRVLPELSRQLGFRS